MFAAESSGGGIFFLAFAALYAIFIFCSREKIRIAIVILKASSNFLIEHMSAIFLSLLVGFVWIVLMIFHLLGMLTSK
jgi:hypothetical protein